MTSRAGQWRVAVLTVSDTRTEADDTSGHYLVEALEQGAGHRREAKAIVMDDDHIPDKGGPVRLDRG